VPIKQTTQKEKIDIIFFIITSGTIFGQEIKFCHPGNAG
jgi:hypothetical protein